MGREEEREKEKNGEGGKEPMRDTTLMLSC